MKMGLVNAKRFFRGTDTPVKRWNPAAAADRARLLMRAFYGILAALTLADTHQWSRWTRAEDADWLWPVAWLPWLPSVAAGAWLILCAHLAAVLIGVFQPAPRWVRILVFLTLLEKVALANSFGKINHNEHLTLLLALVLIFPAFRAWTGSGRAEDVPVLRVFAACQKMILLTYSMSGLGKALVGLWQFSRGEPNTFSPDALARQVAGRLLEGNTTSWLGPWLIENPWVGWPMTWGVLYLQCFAFWAAFRPELHRLWGMGLILFHLAVFLFMDLHFRIAPFWLVLFLMLSPFASPNIRWRNALESLPLFGPLLLGRRRS